ncbi:MAG: GHKL domain-containing protein, partial [Oscillospiraceae bacterium]|nr:GHKL domain-containing protein [Oscillospiraceae bacterium]
YGTKSIRYVAEQYGGKLEIKVDGNMFFLSVLFPVQK